MKKRLDQSVLRINPRVKTGYYSDKYFNRTKDILESDNHHPILKMQIFQRNKNACVCGIDEAIEVLRLSLGSDFNKLTIKALHDGDIINAWESVMTIEGDYSLFAHLETVYLGALARGTKVATNVYRCVEAANGKPVLFFPARFDSYLVQAKDGYSYSVGMLAAGTKGGIVSTDAQGEWWGAQGSGTMPHGLIAAYNGNTVKAALKFCEYTDINIKRIVLVDFDNDCVKTAVDVAQAMFEKYKLTKDERYKLTAVRLDTSGTMVDKSIRINMDVSEYLGSFKPTGVNPLLVINVKTALIDLAIDAKDKEERKFYRDIGVVVSGGFNPEKIKMFEGAGSPSVGSYVMAYGVGSSLFGGNFDFTADIVQRYENGKWIHNAKKGRTCFNEPKLEIVK